MKLYYLALTAFLVSSTLCAQTATTTFQVNVKVKNFCLIGDDTRLFQSQPQGGENNFNAENENQKKIVVTCALGTPYTVIMEKQVAMAKPKSKPVVSPSNNAMANRLKTAPPAYANQQKSLSPAQWLQQSVSQNFVTQSLAMDGPLYNDMNGMLAAPAAPAPVKTQTITHDEKPEKPSPVKVTVSF